MNPKPKLSLVLGTSTAVLALFVIIPMSLNIRDFNGYCLLYSQVNDTNITQGVSFEWGNSGNCNFILYMGYTSLIASLVILAQTAMLVWKDYDRTPFSSFLVFCGTGILTIALLIAALISTVGYSTWCSNFTDKSMCESVDMSWLDKTYGVVASHFYSYMMVTQFGVWGSLCVWGLAWLVALCKVKHYHDNDELLQNWAHEKERLFPRRSQYSRVHFAEDHPTT